MIEVVHPGLYASIQDTGRLGYRKFGVPRSGVMDAAAARLANALLGKEESAPLIEIGQSGCKLRFHKSAAIVLCGAEVVAQLNGLPLKQNRLLVVRAGDLFEIKSCLKGVWSYLGIQGDLKIENRLNSYSQFAGITRHARLHKGDEIHFCQSRTPKSPNSRIAASYIQNDQLELLVYKGPEFDLLNEPARQLLLATDFQPSNGSNRMAYTFEQGLTSHSYSILTCPVLPGTVQWTPSGKLFCLMRDAQTTGGYPRILIVSRDHLSLLSQKGIGQPVRWVVKEAP